MALLFIITVLSLTGTIVDSASNVTGCDAPLTNALCTQGSCLQPPCMMRCGLTASYGQCLQTCNSSCDFVKCTASDRCLQTCSTGNCKSMTCNAQNCLQKCESATCGMMTCVKNAKSPTSCEQSSKSGEMICENELCDQYCTNGNCTLKCSSNVKRCTQTCDGGNCQYKCEAQDDCTLRCTGGKCTEIKPATTQMPPTTTPTSTTTTTPTSTTTTTSSSNRLQMTASVGLASMFVVVAFI